MRWSSNGKTLDSKPKDVSSILTQRAKRGEALMAEAIGSYPIEAGSSPDALTNFQ